MIPIQLWRARIGLFNSKCHFAGHSSRSSSSALFEKSSIPSSAHSPKGDSSPEPSAVEYVLSSDDEHKSRAAVPSAENSPSEYTTALFRSTCIVQQPADRSSCSTRKLGSSHTVYSLLPSTDVLYLPRDLLRDAVAMLLIVIVSKLLVLSGDIETNPGPIACEYNNNCMGGRGIWIGRAKKYVYGLCKALKNFWAVGTYFRRSVR